MRRWAAACAAMAATAAAVPALASPSGGRLAGTLYLSGGPRRAGARPRPAREWQVLVERPGGRTATGARTGSDGRFTVGLPPGRYLVAGRYSDPPRHTCAPQAVEITAGATTHVRIYCSIR